MKCLWLILFVTPLFAQFSFCKNPKYIEFLKKAENSGVENLSDEDFEDYASIKRKMKKCKKNYESLKKKEEDKKPFNYSTPIMSSTKDDITELPPPPEILANIAVVDFAGNNITNGEVRALTDRLRAELVRTKYFKVIEREMMNEVLEEQGLQQSGCTTDECMVQIGRLIGVEKILGGNISKVGNIYSVTSRIVSVETGEIEKTEIFDHTGDIGQLLTNGMRMVAIGLAK